MACKILTIIAFLAVSSFAGESVHLVNCHDNTSRVYYYSNDGDYPPTDEVAVSASSYMHWEGRPVTAHFTDSGTTFTSNIQANAGGYSPYSYAGTGNNNYRSFNCYRDDEHEISGTDCQSIYYCFDS